MGSNTWEGIRQVCATLLGARHAPERLCGGSCLHRGAITSVRPLPLPFGCRHRPRYHINFQLDLELHTAHRCHLSTLKQSFSQSHEGQC